MPSSTPRGGRKTLIQDRGRTGVHVIARIVMPRPIMLRLHSLLLELQCLLNGVSCLQSGLQLLPALPPRRPALR